MCAYQEPTGPKRIMYAINHACLKVVDLLSAMSYQLSSLNFESLNFESASGGLNPCPPLADAEGEQQKSTGDLTPLRMLDYYLQGSDQ
jgi:hypothetical protein